MPAQPPVNPKKAANIGGHSPSFAGLTLPTGPQGPVGPQGPPGTGGTGGGGGAIGVSASAAVGLIAPVSDIEFAASGNMSVHVEDIGGGSARVTYAPSAIYGPSGPTGPQGPQGPQGASGAIGATGPSGAVGPQGIQGIQGPQSSLAISASAGRGLIVPIADLEFAASGNLAVSVQDLGGGSGRILYAPSGTPPGGPQGPVGPQGIAGLTGATGPQGSQGPGQSVAIGPSATPPTINPALDIEYAASGNLAVSVQNLGGGSARVLYAPSGTPPGGPQGPQGPQGIQGTQGIQGISGTGGGGAIAVSGSAALGLISPTSDIEFAASGNLAVAVQPLGGGSARVLYAPSAFQPGGPTGATGASGATGAQGAPGNPLGVSGSAKVGLIVPTRDIEFASRGGTNVTLQDLGGGSARVIHTDLILAGSAAPGVSIPPTTTTFPGSGIVFVASSTLPQASGSTIVSASAGSAIVTSNYPPNISGLTAGATATGLSRKDHSVTWYRKSDGAMVARIQAYDDNTNVVIQNTVQAPTSRSGFNQLITQDTTGAIAYLESSVDNAGGYVNYAVAQNALVTLINQSGQSSFLQLLSAVKAQVQYGTVLISIASGASTTAEVTVSHSLGRVPVICLLTLDGGVVSSATTYYKSLTSTTFIAGVSFDSNPGTKTNMSVSWMVIG